MHIHFNTVVAVYAKATERKAGTYFKKHRNLSEGRKFIPKKYNTLKSKEVISTKQSVAITGLHQYINKKIKIEHRC